MTDTCRRPTCTNLSREESGYSGRFCSDRCEVKHEHVKADARDARLSEERRIKEEQ